MRTCSNCGAEQPDIQFQIYRTNKDGTVDYYSKECRTCANITKRIVQKLKAHNPPPPNPSPCDCCGCVRKLQADHNHKTGKFNSYICRKCNVGLGMFNDSEAGLLQAIDYLQRAEWRPSMND